jgi:hypothetical protein
MIIFGEEFMTLLKMDPQAYQCSEPGTQEARIYRTSYIPGQLQFVSQICEHKMIVN